MLGFDVGDLLRAEPVEAAVMTAVVNEAVRLAEIRDRNLAVMIVNAQVESQRKGQRRGGH